MSQVKYLCEAIKKLKREKAVLKKALRLAVDNWDSSGEWSEEQDDEYGRIYKLAYGKFWYDK